MLSSFLSLFLLTGRGLGITGQIRRGAGLGLPLPTNLWGTGEGGGGWVHQNVATSVHVQYMHVHGIHCS